MTARHGRLAGRAAIVTGSGAISAARSPTCLPTRAPRLSSTDIPTAPMSMRWSRRSWPPAASGRRHGRCLQSDQVKDMVAQAEAAFGHVDIAVSNVGRRLRQSFEEITIADWRDTPSTTISARCSISPITFCPECASAASAVSSTSPAMTASPATWTSAPTTSPPRPACTA